MNINSSSQSAIKTIETTNSMKNISPFMSKDLIAAAGFDVVAPIVEAIIGNLAGTLPTKKNEPEMIKCNICDCDIPCSSALNAHNKGIKHKRKLKALEILEQLKDAKEDGVQFRRDVSNPKIWRCEICSKTVNSAQQLEIHFLGIKHRRNVHRANSVNVEVLLPSGKNADPNDATDTFARSSLSKKKKETIKEIYCSFCDLILNSQNQYREHLLSKKHVSRAKKSTETIQF